MITVVKDTAYAGAKNQAFFSRFFRNYISWVFNCDDFLILYIRHFCYYKFYHSVIHYSLIVILLHFSFLSSVALSLVRNQTNLQTALVRKS